MRRCASERRSSPLAASIGTLDLPPCLIDGEIVAFGADGNPDFSALQAVLKRGHGAQDTKTELFTGANAEAANRDLVAKREGRAGFKIPTKF